MNLLLKFRKWKENVGLFIEDIDREIFFRKNFDLIMCVHCNNIESLGDLVFLQDENLGYKFLKRFSAMRKLEDLHTRHFLNIITHRFRTSDSEV